MKKLIRLVLAKFPDEHNELYYAPLGSLEEGDEVLCETESGGKEIGVICTAVSAFEGGDEYRMILKAAGVEDFRLRPVLKRLVAVKLDEERYKDDRTTISSTAGMG